MRVHERYLQSVSIEIGEHEFKVEIGLVVSIPIISTAAAVAVAAY
jgi:hypothetical protein